MYNVPFQKRQGPLFQQTFEFYLCNVFFFYITVISPSPLKILSFWLKLTQLLLRKIYKEIIHFDYLTYMAMPKHKNLCPWSHEFEISVDPSSVIITLYIVLSLSELCPGVERKFFEEIQQF